MLKHADRIVFMDKGSIKAIGNFDSLFEKETMFKKMVLNQTLV